MNYLALNGRISICEVCAQRNSFELQFISDECEGFASAVRVHQDAVVMSVSVSRSL